MPSSTTSIWAPDVEGRDFPSKPGLQESSLGTEAHATLTLAEAEGPSSPPFQTLSIRGSRADMRLPRRLDGTSFVPRSFFYRGRVRRNPSQKRTYEEKEKPHEVSPVRKEVMVIINPSLTKGSVEFLVLSILEGGEYHGYQIAKQIQERSRSLLAFRRSSIYPVLSRMEGRGWIAPRWTNGKRRQCFYRLTEEGKEALERHRIEWRAFTTGVNLVVDASNGG